jgi:uncharacterized protein
MTDIISEPSFYLVAVPAVILVGLAKGGLGGALGLVGVPLMALVVSPLQAAAILLPILVLMDMASLWFWRGYFDRRTLAIMLPGAMIGIGAGWLTAALVTADMVRLILGLVSLLFVSRWMMQKIFSGETATGHNRMLGMFWGAVSGFTSFVAHAGGPPYQVYTLPRRFDSKIFTGTSVIFFATVNAVKLLPYFALGQFDSTNIATSFALAPLAPLATLSGAWVVKRMRPEVFYPISYAAVLIVAIKLLWDGVAAFMW